jgi:hypothetical protein
MNHLTRISSARTSLLPPPLPTPNTLNSSFPTSPYVSLRTKDRRSPLAEDSCLIQHREEPPVALVALGLWNTSHLSPHSMDHSRLWKTSHVLPFLGHVALERLSCKGEQDYMRVIVNGAAQELDTCRDGPGGSCELGRFEAYVKERVERWKDFEGACKE